MTARLKKSIFWIYWCNDHRKENKKEQSIFVISTSFSQSVDKTTFIFGLDLFFLLQEKLQVRCGELYAFLSLSAPTAVDQSISRLQHKEVRGRVQHNRAGLGWGGPSQFWSTATKEQRKTMVVEEVARVDQERYLIKAVSQGKKGAWTRWEDTTSRVVSWADVWRTPQAQL